MTGTIAMAYNNLDYKGYERVQGCYGECYEEYVRTHGTVVEIEQRKQELANADEFSSIRGLWAGCAACHGQNGGGGMGPKLTGQSAEYIVTALQEYKNNETRGPQSAMMWGQAAMLSDKDMELIAEMIKKEFN